MLKNFVLRATVCFSVALLLFALPANTEAQKSVVVTGPDMGHPPEVIEYTYDMAGNRVFCAFPAYPLDFTGGVRVATGDVNGEREAVLQGLDFRPLLNRQDSQPFCVIPREYRISFLGRDIFDAVIKTLRRDGVPPLLYQPPDGSLAPIPMPDLDNAEFVLLSGGSAA